MSDHSDSQVSGSHELSQASEYKEEVITGESEVVHLINVKTQKCKKSKVSEILNPEIFYLAEQQYIILIQNPCEQTIISIRQAYNLHPVIEYECNSTSYIKDHVVQLDECLFLTLIDIPSSADLSSPTCLKIILTKSLMFLLITGKLNCIEEVFVKGMNFHIFEETKSQEKLLQEVQEQEMIMLKMKKRFTIKLDLVQFYELTDLEEILYKLMHVMFIRIEERVAEMDLEVKICNDFVTQYEYTEWIDLIMRVHRAKKELIYAKGYVDLKAKLLPEIIEGKLLSQTFNQYLYSMALNMKKLGEKIDSSMLLLKSSEHLYEAIIQGRLSKNSENVQKLVTLYSACMATFLPLYIAAGSFGMNVLIPFRNDTYVTLVPFGIICLISVLYLLFVVWLFKYRGWL